MPDAPTKPKRRRRRRKKPDANGNGQGSEHQLNYDAAESTTKRAAPSTRLKSTDQLLTPTKRKKLTAGARDLAQNFSIASWAIRRHLDYVSTFTFQPTTGDPEVDARLTDLMSWYARPLNCDVAGRHSLQQLTRLAEERRTVDGDVFFVKLSDGHLQAIEGDRVRDPSAVGGSSTDGYIHGIKTTKSGRPTKYAIHRRTDNGGYEFERAISAGNVLHLGYFDRFDQLRGVSPLAPAINTFRDLYEAWDYSLLKCKVASMFGLVFSRESSEGWGDVSAAEDTGYKVDMGKGPIVLDLDPGDTATFIESKSPPAEFQNFTMAMTAAALKSLDLPISFYDEGYTNFFGSRSAFIHYEKSAKTKRRSLTEFLDRITGWRLSLFIADGELVLPAGATLADLSWSWVGDGTPWWNPSQEINADIAAIGAGLKTRTQVVRERHGQDFKTIIDTLAEEEAYMRDARPEPAAEAPPEETAE